jgi:hypothetical protein
MHKASDSVVAHKNPILDSTLSITVLYHTHSRTGSSTRDLKVKAHKSITPWRRPNFYALNYTNHYSFAFNLNQTHFMYASYSKSQA